MQQPWPAIEAALARHQEHGARITTVKPVSGGDINKTYCVHAGNGIFLVKINDRRLQGLFACEQQGLEALKQTGALRVPAPLLTGETGNYQFLVMEWLSPGAPCRDFWQRFGHGLAGLHRCTAERFGWPSDNYIGPLLQPNAGAASWSDFYAGQRLLPMIKLAFNKGRCRQADMADVESICRRLETWFSPAIPSLLHGDLWSGNYMAGPEGEPAVFDPAVYYGHREMDLAMSLLFGGFDKAFYEAYEEAFPLGQGWRERAALCQLYPLLVHLVLFGDRYYGQVKEVLRKYS